MKQMKTYKLLSTNLFKLVMFNSFLQYFLVWFEYEVKAEYAKKKSHDNQARQAYKILKLSSIQWCCFYLKFILKNFTFLIMKKMTLAIKKC